MAVWDQKKDRIYYHDNREDESKSLFEIYPVKTNIDDGLTVILITVEKLSDNDNLVYFEVNENDNEA